MKWSKLKKGLHFTLYYTAVHALIGMAVGLLGPTLPQMAADLGALPESLGVVFVFRGIGSLITSFASGFLYDRFRGHPIIVIFTALMAVSCVIIPFSTLVHKYFWAAMFGLLGAGGGASGVGINTLVVWAHGVDVGPHIQFLHFGFGFGALLSPVIVGQVLAATGGIAWSYWALAVVCVPLCVLGLLMRSPVRPHTTTAATAEAVALGHTPNASAPVQEQREAGSVVLVPATADRRVSLVLTPRGAVTVSFTPHEQAVSAAVAAVRAEAASGGGRYATGDWGPPPPQMNTRPSEAEASNFAPVATPRALKATDPRHVPHWMIALLAALLFFYVGAEVGYGGWLPTYALDRGLVDELSAPYLNTAFFGAITVGRLLGVPMSLWLRPLPMLLVNMCSCVLTTVLLSLFTFSHIALWVLSAAYGVSLGSIYATVCSYPASVDLHLSSRDTMWLVVGGALGEMMVPFVMGPLFENFGYWLLPWTLVVSTALQTGLLGLVWTVARRKGLLAAVPAPSGVVKGALAVEAEAGDSGAQPLLQPDTPEPLSDRQTDASRAEGTAAGPPPSPGEEGWPGRRSAAGPGADLAAPAAGESTRRAATPGRRRDDLTIAVPRAPAAIELGALAAPTGGRSGSAPPSAHGTGSGPATPSSRLPADAISEALRQRRGSRVAPTQYRGH